MSDKINYLKEEIVKSVLIDFLLNDVKLPTLNSEMIDSFIKKCKERNDE